MNPVSRSPLMRAGFPLQNQTAEPCSTEWLGCWEAVGGSFLFLKWSCQLSWKLLVCPVDCGGGGRGWVIMDHHGCCVMDAVLAQGRWPRGEGRRVSGLAESGVYTGGSRWCLDQPPLTHLVRGGGCLKYGLQGPAPGGDVYSGAWGRTLVTLSTVIPRSCPQPPLT